MSKKIKSDGIPKPCQENWLELNPDEKSRFCTLCQKNIFDFTNEQSATTNEVCLRYSTTTKNLKKEKPNILENVLNYIIRKK